MAKKGFEQTAEQASPVYEKLVQAQDIREAQEAMQTQGKKGIKAMRINMAFTPSNIDYVRVMAAIKGITMTQFVNDIIERDRETYGEKYETAKNALKDL